MRQSSNKISEAIAAQNKLCADKGLPHFAPYDGVCWSCYRQIYDELDGLSFITGCPYCHRSYCD